MRLVNCWHAVGPALVLAWAGEPAVPPDWPLYVARARLAVRARLRQRGGPRVVGPRRTAEDAASRDGLGLHHRRGAGVDRPRRGVRGTDSPYGCGARDPARRSARRVRAGAQGADRPRARAARRLPRHRVPARRRRRGGRRLHRLAQPRRRRPVARGRRRARHRRERERRDVEFAALLHDVGKIRIPNEIINKPGALTPGGARDHRDAHDRGRADARIASAACSATIGQIVRSCHERWDGTGYPDGLERRGDPARGAHRRVPATRTTR